MTVAAGAHGDPWLARWLPLLAERAGKDPVLELGCAAGRDTATLVDAGLHVVAIELSPDAVAQARVRVPAGAQFHCQDFRDPFPLPADATVGVVLASLSLHYFEWDATLELVRRIHRVLRPNGVLLCRLNSVNDLHYGGRGPLSVTGRDEDCFYLFDGFPKRFFDRAAVERLFADGWHMRHLEEVTIDRYEHPKVAWEVVLEPRPLPY
ncbi:class I SAM-dependent methyltransferase [Variovorax sp. EL159]|uniref:class I SAM-dependent methyltransferase n=1 Tax=Variovorax sp. EL159 TaxID=1566270 RepID=UPI00087E96E4|nr:class I SAM-dependent methyltransferase [Variovorax sp. EL159]SCX73912.1 Methyltransferase domain-containing protein [Variovorax sp. EL159]